MEHPPGPCSTSGVSRECAVIAGGDDGFLVRALQVSVVPHLHERNDILHDLLVVVAGNSGRPAVAGLRTAGLGPLLGVPHRIHVIRDEGDDAGIELAGVKEHVKHVFVAADGKHGRFTGIAVLEVQHVVLSLLVLRVVAVRKIDVKPLVVGDPVLIDGRFVINLVHAAHLLRDAGTEKGILLEDSLVVQDFTGLRDYFSEFLHAGSSLPFCWNNSGYISVKYQLRLFE